MAPIDDIAKIIRQAIIDALKDREPELRAIAEAGGSKAGGSIFGDVGSIASVLNLLLDTVALVQPEFAIPIAIKDAAEHAGGKLGEGFAIGDFLGQMVYTFATPYLNYITHFIASEAQSELWDPQTAASLVSKRIVHHDQGASDAHGGGLDTPHFDALVSALENRPDVQTLMLLRNLDQLSDEQVTEALKRHDYPDEWIRPLFALRRTLLSPADLALANLRGFMDDTTMLEYAKQLGITVDDMNVLINNTGEPPGSVELQEALRRGFIDQERFAHGIRQSRVRNEWLDVLVALREAPMSTAEAVRAVIQNYLTDEQGRAIALQNGLIPEHYEPLKQSYGRPLSHEQMMTLYFRGQVTLEDVRQAFRESDLKDKYIDPAIELARRLIPERTIVSMLDHGVGTKADALERLHAQGYNDKDAEALIALGTAQHAQTHKQLSRTDIISMYEDAIIGHNAAVQRLVTLGYSPQDADAALELADYKAKAGALKTTERGIEATLKAHHITEQQARTELIRAGLDSQQANRLVDQWVVQKVTPTRTLTESQILKLGKEQWLSPEDVLTRLKALGLSQGDAELLMKMDGIIK